MASNNAGSIFFDIKVNDQLSEQIVKSIENVQKLGAAIDDVKKAALMKDVGRGAELIKKALFDVNRLRRQFEESARRSTVLGVDTKAAQENIDRLIKKEKELIDLSGRLATTPMGSVVTQTRGADITNMMKGMRDNLNLQRQMNSEAERYEKSMKSAADVSRTIGDAMGRLRTSITAGNLAGMDTRKLQSQLSALDALRSSLPTNISKHQMGTISGMIGESGRMSASMNESVKNIDKIDDRLRRLNMTREKLQNSIQTGNLLGISTTSSVAEMKNITKQIDMLRNLRERITRGTGNVTDAEINVRYKDVAESASKAAAAQDKANRARVASNKEETRDLNTVQSTLNKITEAKDRLSAKRSVASAMGLDTSGMDSILAKLDQYRATILGAGIGGGAKLSRDASLASIFSQGNMLGTTSDKNVQSLKSVEDKLHDLVTLKDRLTSSAQSGTALGIDTSKTSGEITRMERQIQSLTALRDKLRTNPTGVNMSQEMRGYHEIADAARRAAQEQEKANRKAQQSRARTSAEDLGAIKRRDTALGQIEKKLNDLQKLEGKALKMGVDTTELQRAIQVLNNVYAELARVQNLAGLNRVMRRQTAGTPSTYQSGMETARMATSNTRDAISSARANETRAARSATDAQNQLNRAKREEESVNRRILSQMDSLARKSTSLGGVFGELGNQISMAFSIYGIEQFLKSVITVGGEFEQQHVALKSILGDVQQADSMFSNIKSLAVVSPYSFRELASYTKQLSAFSIPYEELYDTTKRLADISSGLGVDMSRIILAYGQVRSASVLRGQELRQFTEAGLPMVDALAKKLTEARGELVSTADVFKLISERAVSFNMVKEILEDLTNEGGKFYNMQFVLSDTLYGKWSNLQDAWEIMLSDIAKGETLSGRFLKGLVSLLTDAINGVNELGAGITAFGLMAVGKRVRDWAIGNATSGYKAMMTAAANVNMQDYQLALGKSPADLTARESELINSQGKLTQNDYNRLAVMNAQNTSILQQMRLNGQLNDQLLAQLVAEQRITAEQAKQIRNASKLSTTFQGLRGIVGSIGATFKGMLPIMAVAAAFQGVMALISQYNKAGEMVSQAAEGWTQRYQDLKKAVEEINKMKPSTDAEYATGIASMKEVLSGVRSDYNDIIKEAEALSKLSEQYEYLKGKLELTADGYDRLSSSKRLYEDIMNDTAGGLIGEIFHYGTIADTAEDYDEALQEIESARMKVAKYSKEIQNEINKEFSESTRKSFGMIGKTVEEQLDIIAKNSSLSSQFTFGFFESDEKDIAKNYVELRMSLKDEGDRMSEQAKKVANDFITAMGLDPNDMSKATEENKEKLRIYFDSFIGTIGDVGDKTREAMRNVMYGIGQITLGDNGKEPPKTNMYKYVRSRLSTVNFDDDAVKRMTQDDSGVQKTWETLMKSVKDEYDEAKRNLDIIKGQKGDTDIISEDEKAAEKRFLKAEEAYKALYVKTDKENAKDNKKQTDTWLQTMNKRISLLEKYMSVYRELADVYGETEAKRRLNESGDYSVLAALGITDPSKTAENYGKILAMFKANRNGSEERQQKEQEIQLNMSNALRKEDEKAIEAQNKALQKQLDIMDEQWSMYKRIKEATGDKNMAYTVSFGMPYQEGADDYRKMVRDAFDRYSASRGYGYTYSSVSGMSDAEKQAMPKDIREQYEEMRANIEKYDEEERSRLADILSNYQTTTEKTVAIEQKAAEEIAAIRKARDEGKITGGKASSLIRQVESQRDYDVFKQSSQYMQFFNAMYSLTISEAEKTGRAIKENLDKKLQAGVITLKEYSDEMETVRKQIESIRNIKTDWAAFATGGLNSLLNNMYNRGVSMYNKGASDSEQGRTNFQSALANMDYDGMMDATQMMKAGESMKSAGAAMSGSASQAMGTVQMIDQIVHGIDDMVQGINKSVESISEMIDALGGDTSAGSTWGDVSNFTSVFAKASSNATSAWDSLKSGDMGGVISGVAGSITSWVTGFAQYHDAKLDEVIEESKREQKILENISSNIEKMLEYTMGGIYNYSADESTREALRGKASDVASRDSAIKSLLSAFGLDVSSTMTDSEKQLAESVKNAEENDWDYYSTQYASLIAQRNEAEKQLAAEEDKKDSDDSAIEDYKQQITELNMEIENFAQDMAESLYGIDFKSWANTLAQTLVDAWASGANAAKAYKEAVSDLLKDVAVSAIQQKYIEQMLEPLMDDFLEQFSSDDGKLTDASWALLEEMYSVGDEAIEATNSVMNALEQLANSHGATLKDTDSSSVSGSVQSVTEETADLLAAYINAIRAYSAENMNTLKLINVALTEYLPSMENTLASQLSVQRQIETNTLATATASQEILSLLRQVTYASTNGKAIRV